jgi:SAM-dependent methyltransferase
MRKTLSFSEEIDEYIVLRLLLYNYQDNNRSLPPGAEIVHPSIRAKIRKQEKQFLKLYFRHFKRPYLGNLPGWRDDSSIYLFWNGQLACGVYLCDKNEFDTDKNWGQLHYAFVDTRFKGRGFYGLVFKEAVRRAQSWGLKGLYLNSDRHILPKVYERWGAELWKKIPKLSKNPNCKPKDPHNWLVHRIHDAALKEALRRYAHGILLDIGCGEKPYQALTEGLVSKHIGLDHPGSLHSKQLVDIFGTAYDTGLADEAVDTILCTAVLEHLEEPEQALRECYRILKPGGVAIYSVPFIWHLNEEPRDFYRFSKYGLDYLFKKVGFEVVEIKALSGFWVTFGQLLVYNLYRLNRGPLRWLRIIDGLGLALQGMAYLLDRFDRTEQWTWMYSVVARKP